MKTKISIVAVLLTGLLFFESCNPDDTVIVGDWKRSVDFSGYTRSGAFQFTINDKTYVGLGLGGVSGAEYLLDGYVYDLDTKIWSKIAPFPGVGRELSVSFTLKGKGYVGLGYNHNITTQALRYFNDFWEYDPSDNSWTQLSDFPGDRRFNALAFTYGENAFVGCGTNGSYFNDFFKYNPDNDSWTGFATFPNKRQGGAKMVIGGKVYAFGGDSNGLNYIDFYEFNPEATSQEDTWLDRSKPTTDGNYNDYVTAVRRSNAQVLTMTVDGVEKGYVICGTVSGSSTNTVYEYEPITDTWTKKTNFEGTARTFFASWVVAGRGFIGLGSNGTGKFDDVWEWKPADAFVP